MSKTRAAYKTESSGQQPQSLWNLPSLKTHPTLINAAHHLKKGSAPPHSESQQVGDTGWPAGAASWVPPGRETMEGEGQAPPQGQNLEAWDIPAGSPLGHLSELGCHQGLKWPGRLRAGLRAVSPRESRGPPWDLPLPANALSKHHPKTSTPIISVQRVELGEEGPEPPNTTA